MSQELATILQSIGTLTGWAVFAVIIVVLHRAGVLTILLGFLKKNGNHNHMEERVKDLESHASVANSEMSEVKERLISLETKMDLLLRHFKI